MPPKFIGGAEKARQNARKRKFAPQNNESSTNQSRNSNNKNAYPNQLRVYVPSIRFFASLLTCHNIHELAISNNNTNVRSKLMKDICGRAGVPLPARLPISYRDAQHYYTMLLSLVLEESRYILAEALLNNTSLGYPPTSANESTQNHPNSSHGSGTSSSSSDRTPKSNWKNENIMAMELIDMTQSKESNKVGFTLTFSKRRNQYSNRPEPFTPPELFHHRPGTVFLLSYNQGDDNNGNNNGDGSKTVCILGNVTIVHKRISNPNKTQGQDMDSMSGGKDCELSLSVFPTTQLVLKGGSMWEIQPLTTLIGELRQFEACFNIPKVDFLPKILGWKEPSHIRFSDENDVLDDGRHVESSLNEGQSNYKGCPESNTSNDQQSVSNCTSGHGNGKNTVDTNFYTLNALNYTQEEAALKFLNSPSSTLAIVQGPPGTGKTTFTSALLARNISFTDDNQNTKKRKRVLVAAPTNKAVTVLATTFLNSLKDDASINIILIGVEDKLVSDDDYSGSVPSRQGDDFTVAALPSSLRSIFIYTWLDEILRDFQSVKIRLKSFLNNPSSLSLSSSEEEIKNLVKRAIWLVNKIQRSIPTLLESSGSLFYAVEFVTCLERSSYSAQSGENLTRGLSLMDSLEESLKSIHSGDVIEELLETADIIFCTLSTSGVSVMKRTNNIDDLFVDEAAAATEAEIAIPFHLKPKRMLAVGDPKQLPATISSRLAVDCGLDKSLLHRMIYDCDREYTMLNVQYRMLPDISSYPSFRFYDGRLENGGNVIRSDYKGKVSILGGTPYSFFQINGREERQGNGSYFNMHEAQAVVDLVKSIQQASLTATSTTGDEKPWYSPEKIRIITFYQGQVASIRRLLNQNGLGKVLVATVDSSQGCEAEIIIVSFVRSNANRDKNSKAGFLQDDRRMNVALTRAKHQLICIGDALGTLSTSGVHTLQTIVEDAKRRNLLRCYKTNRLL